MASLKEIRQQLGWAEDQLLNFLEKAGGAPSDPPPTSSALHHVRTARADLSEHITDDTTEPEPEPEPTDGDPTLPQVTVEQARPTVQRTVSVASRTDLDAALADAQPGDEVVVTADLPGPVSLPNLAEGWATIRGPLGDGRIGASEDIPSIFHDGNGGALRIEGARGWWCEGLEARPDTSVCREGLVCQDARDVRFHRMRVWAPGDLSARQIRRGVRFNGEHLAMTGSRVEGVIRSGAQSQGIGIWSGAGPYWIEDNFVEALNQNVLVGGATPASLAHNPSDGTIRRNHLYTRPSWRDHTGTIFVFEWKAGERWLAEENVVENDYQGFTVGVKAPSETQGVEGQRTGDITVRRNRYIGEFPGVGAYMLFRGASTAHREDASRFLLEDELWEVQRNGRGIRLGGAPDGMIVRRVTCHGSHSSLEVLNGAPAGESPRLVIEDYRARSGTYGLWLTGSGLEAGMPDAYVDHTFRDYWQYWGMDSASHPARHADIPDTLSAEAQAEFHDIEHEADIPAHVGANASALPDPAGIRDPDRPE